MVDALAKDGVALGVESLSPVAPTDTPPRGARRTGKWSSS
jgi:hypothetical protein